MPDIRAAAPPKRIKGKRRRKRERPVIGWREWIALPALGIERIKAKIDTGARTSALHAFRIKPMERDGKRYLRFFIHPEQGRRLPEVACEAPLVDDRIVVSSNGEREHRYVIETLIRAGNLEWPIEITLTNRDEMSFRMLLGRQALRRRFVIDPGSSYKLTQGVRRSRSGKTPPSQAPSNQEGMDT